MKYTTLLLLAGALASSSPLALAQSGSTSTSHPSSTAGMDKSASKNGPRICLADGLIGTGVVSPQGEKLGKIEDIVVHPGGEVAYAVLSFGGILGIGDKLFAIPWSTLKSAAIEPGARAKKGDPLVLSIEKEQLKNAPGFDKDHWPEMANVDWAKDVDKYYAAAGTARRSDAHTAEASAKKSPWIWKVSELKGLNVETPTNTKLGDISDVAIDTNGRVSYVVLSVGGVLGIGDRKIPVPWDAMTFTRDPEGKKKHATLAETKERLEGAPQVKDGKASEAEMCDPIWVGHVYDYYSVHPYWSRSDMDEKPRNSGDKNP